MDTITAQHIAYKKRIGTLKSEPVIEFGTTGGLVLVVTRENGKMKTLGTGPHRAVARHIAQKNHPALKVTELSKSDWLDPASIQSVEAKYTALTAALNDVESRE